MISRVLKSVFFFFFLIFQSLCHRGNVKLVYGLKEAGHGREREKKKLIEKEPRYSRLLQTSPEVWPEVRSVSRGEVTLYHQGHELLL